MIVKYQKDIVFDNRCGAIFSKKQLRTAILYFTQTGKPVCRLKRVFMHGKYPAISIHGKKIHIHRIIMSWLGCDWLPTNIYVHHKDGNKLNNYVNNLMLMGSSEHQSKTNKGRKQSPLHIAKRVKSTVMTRWGKVHENPDLLKAQQ